MLERPEMLDVGLRLAGALWRFWDLRGMAAEGRAWIDSLLDRTKLDKAARDKAYRAKRPGYDSRAWKKLSRQFLAAHPRCACCGAPAGHAHHLDGQSPGMPGGLDPNRLGACRQPPNRLSSRWQPESFFLAASLEVSRLTASLP